MADQKRPLRKIELNQQSQSKAKEAQEASQLQSNLNLKDKKLGQILVSKKLITVKQLSDALILQEQLRKTKKQRLKLGQILLFCELIKLPELQAALRIQTAKAPISEAERQRLKQLVEEKEQQRKDEILLKRMEEENQKSFFGFITNIFDTKANKVKKKTRG